MGKKTIAELLLEEKERNSNSGVSIPFLPILCPPYSTLSGPAVR